MKSELKRLKLQKSSVLLDRVKLAMRNPDRDYISIPYEVGLHMIVQMEELEKQRDDHYIEGAKGWDKYRKAEKRIVELEAELKFKNCWIEQTIKTRLIQANPDLSTVDNPTYTLICGGCDE